LGFHRIRHYGLLSSSARKDSLALARRLLAVPLQIPNPTSRSTLVRHAHAAVGR
jgi:hypothetical protein